MDLAQTYRITKPIHIVNPHVNVDALYGPYESILEANNQINNAYKVDGLTIGILNNGKIIEYQWQNGILSLKNPQFLYGPYTSKTTALSSIPQSLRIRGLTIGIIEDNKLKECWWQNGIEDNDLVVKQESLSIDGYYDIITSPEAPTDTNALWIDTSDFDPISTELNSIISAISILQQRVNILWNLKSAGVVSAAVGDGTRLDIITGDPEYEIPDEIQNILDDLKEKYGEDSLEYQDAYTAATEETDEIKPNYEEGKEPTVPHIGIKMGTWEAFQNNKINFIDGELLWCTGNSITDSHNNKLYIYNKGVLYPIGGGTTDTGDTMTEEEFNEKFGESFNSAIKNVESIGFIPIGGTEPKYSVGVTKDGILKVYDNTLDNTVPEPTKAKAGYYDEATDAVGLIINSFYLGGTDNNEYSYLSCSHNFVELSNVLHDNEAVLKDINLNGFYLLYINGSSIVSYLPLWGKIPAGGTFLIRGAQCSVMDSNITKLKVKTYDMEWRDSNGNLLSFNLNFGEDNGVAFYLCYGKKVIEGGKIIHKIYTTSSKTDSNGNDNAVDITNVTGFTVDTTTGEVPFGYVDLASVNNTTYKEKQTYTLKNKPIKDYVFRRWYQLDPVKLSNPADGLGKRDNRKYLTATKIDLAVISNYADITEYAPRSSSNPKSIATDKSKFLEDAPNTLTCTFGILATDNGNGATRGFCWNSVGYYNEFLRIRKKGTSDWLTIESIKDEYSALEYSLNCVLNSQNERSGLPSPYSLPKCVYSSEASFKNIFYLDFVRKKWVTSYGQSITTHKVLLSGIKDTSAEGNGTVYEYQVIRPNLKYKEGYDITDNDYEYMSNIREFTVRTSNYINEHGFNFVLTTDLLGASWEEYEIWNISAKVIKKSEDTNKISKYDFTINTGDICYNGSRSNEWIDYYRGYEEALSNKEEMLTVGNNDLAPINMYDIGTGKESPWKINPTVIDYFYAVEFDINNPPFFYKDSSKQAMFKIPSLYSFNYGSYHFISLLSEIRTLKNSNTKKMNVTTVNGIFGIDDSYREGDSNNRTQSSQIYDIEESWLIYDLLQYKGLSVNLENRGYSFEWLNNNRYNENIVNNCSKCFVYIHEMPFNIISLSSYISYFKAQDGSIDTPRETAKAYLNRYHNYEYQRLFKLWGIRLVFGGHKHTVAMTMPVYDAPLGYNPCDSTSLILPLDELVFPAKASFCPFVQILKNDFKYDDWKAFATEFYNNSTETITVEDTTVGANNFKIIDASNSPYQSNIFLNNSQDPECYFRNSRPTVRIEVVDKITAPSYIMCQATGYKNTSNSDLAAHYIPWEKFAVFVNADGGRNKSGNEPGIDNQRAPYFTLYKVSSNSVDVEMYKIEHMYAEGMEVGYWDITAQNLYPLDTLEKNRQNIIDHGYNGTAIEITNQSNNIVINLT